MDTQKDLCIKLLQLFGVSKEVKTEDVKALKILKSHSYALGPVYSFDYQGAHYYAVDDYSLGDNPKLVEDILSEINHLLKGEIVENPTAQADSVIYATELDGIEYYLWKCPIL